MPQIQTQKQNGRIMIWGQIRKRWLVLQPEELIRQLAILYLIEEKKISKSKIQVEKKFLVLGLEKRFDILVYDDDFQPMLLVECKRPDVSIQQDVFDQISLYNIALKVPYLWLTNGPQNYACLIDWESKKYTFIDEVIESLLD